MTKLTVSQVTVIRQSTLEQAPLAEIFGVSQSTISRARSGINHTNAPTAHSPEPCVGLDYLAGLVDGEGCLNVVRSPRGICIAQVRVGQTYLHRVLREIHVTYGGRIRHVAVRGGKEHMVWGVAGSPAVELLKALTPCLRGKRIQAVIVMKLHNKPWEHPKVKLWREALSDLKHEVLL